MYRFIDTDEYQTESILPAEAMSYNGTYIEYEIPGYRTLYTSGRELLVSELQTGEINGIDGARYLGRRRPIRTITVGYQLIAESDRDFREKFNRLNYLLRGEQVEIIFKDEPDKYFIGTKTGNSEIEPGMNSIIGEIEITCTDPYKYSTVVKSFVPELVDGTLTLQIVNEGTEPCAIQYEIVNNAENGYIGILSEQGTMRFGAPEEVDGEEVTGNEVLSTIANWPATRVTSSALHPTYNYQGTVKKVSGRLMIDSFGSRTDGTWNGACNQLTIPADSTGAFGAKDFYCWCHHRFETGLNGQTGEQGIVFLTDDNTVICGMQIVKSDAVGNDAYVEWFVNGKIKQQIGFTPSAFDSQNPYNGRGANDFRKEGNKVTFHWWGSYFSFVDPAITNMVCTKIQVTFDNYGNRDSYVSENYIAEIKFQKLGVQGWRNVPNRYDVDDVVVIDGNDSKVIVNGMDRPGDEVVGTKYFKAKPGVNDVQIVVSDWCEELPDVTAYIREVWQ